MAEEQSDFGEHPVVADKPRRLLHYGLFAATCLTTTKAGATFSAGVSWGQVLADPSVLLNGLPFSISLMTILLFHEMGHYIVARYRGVEASAPFFLPLPFGVVGTLGAVIGMPPTRRRDTLMDIGAAGPLVGLVVAIPVLIYGISLSPVKPMAGGLIEGNSAIYLLVKFIIKGQYLPGGGVDVHLHQVAWAGWVGLLVTMLNLLPIGQLDGGHIAYARFGEGQNRVSALLHRAMAPAAVGAFGYSFWELSVKYPMAEAAVRAISAGFPYVVWGGLLALFRRFSDEYHPPVGEEPLSRGRRGLFVVMVIVFVSIAMPIPIRQAP